MAENEIILLAVGDIGPIHPPVDAYSKLVRPALAGADIRFAQAERVYSERGAFQIHSGGAHSRVAPAMASIFTDCGFDIVSLASNHAMDWGPEALLDSKAVFEKLGIATIGAGRNLAEARQAKIIERNGVRVSFLAYCSVLNAGYAATSDKPGVAPLRAHTYYEPTEYQAGIPPRVVTVPYADDLRGMEDDIHRAKASSDVVVVSQHWGIHYIPRMIADYQRTAAKAAFAAGADLILGHHAHVPKAIETFGDKVCFYSLSNFIMTVTEKSPAAAAEFSHKYGVPMDPDYPRLPYGAEGKRSLIVRGVLGKAGVKRVSFLPVMIDKQLRPEILHNEDPRFADAVQFMDWVSEGYGHRFQVEGDEVVVQAPLR